jgi:hypothetical protein
MHISACLPSIPFSLCGPLSFSLPMSFPISMHYSMFSPLCDSLIVFFLVALLPDSCSLLSPLFSLLHHSFRENCKKSDFNSDLLTHTVMKQASLPLAGSYSFPIRFFLGSESRTCSTLSFPLLSVSSLLSVPHSQLSNTQSLVPYSLIT